MGGSHKLMLARWVAALCAICVMLSACSGLPRRGGVTVVERSTTPSGGVVLDAKGPTVGSTPEELIQGFLRASSAGVSDDFRVARQFLTPEAAARWNPSNGVSIFSDSESVEFSQTPNGAVLASVPALGSVDNSGNYIAATPGSTISHEFSLMVNENGEWRIAALDDAVMMTQTVFSSVYVRSPLYFLNSTNSALIPDVRWFPRSRALSLMSTSLVTGPAAWLTTTAHTAYVSDANKAEMSVTVEDSTALVELPAGVAGLSPANLALLEAQFTKTLVGSGLVQRVELTAQGAYVSSGQNLDLPTYPYTTSPLITIVQGNVVSIQGGKGIALRLDNEYTPSDFANIAVAPAQPASRMVGRSADGLRLSMLPLSKGKETLLYASAKKPATGAALAAPSIDSSGWVWSADAAMPGVLLAINLSTGEQVRLSAPDLASGSVLQIAVSREGSRVVVLLSGNNTSQLAA
ncbi:MAG: LpqB family beta-propeller domain-containing protein, partial [Arcanobacterium sp.]|nr:LpqB family beta-propeller domain-containing protein [Arcanobacterium sp.]